MLNIVNWNGPYTWTPESRDRFFGDYGVYAWTGRIIGQHTHVGQSLHYIGMTCNSFHERFKHSQHKHWRLVRDEKQVWLGKLINRRTCEAVRATEQILISYCVPTLAGTDYYLPNFSCIVESRFSNRRRPAIPEYVSWDHINRTLRRGTIRVENNDDFYVR